VYSELHFGHLGELFILHPVSDWQTLRSTGSEKRSDERAALFAVPVHAIFRDHILGSHRNSITPVD